MREIQPKDSWLVEHSTNIRSEAGFLASQHDQINYNAVMYTHINHLESRWHLESRCAQLPCIGFSWPLITHPREWRHLLSPNGVSTKPYWTWNLQKWSIFWKGKSVLELPGVFFSNLIPGCIQKKTPQLLLDWFRSKSRVQNRPELFGVSFPVYHRENHKKWIKRSENRRFWSFKQNRLHKIYILTVGKNFDFKNGGFFCIKEGDKCINQAGKNGPERFQKKTKNRGLPLSICSQYCWWTK